MKRFNTLILMGLLVCMCSMVNAAVVHKYTFNTNGQAKDSVGTADLTINGTASVSGGELILPGGGTRANNAGATGAALTELAATINGTNTLTMEIWFSQNVNNDWSKLFMCGQGSNDNYMDITPRRGNAGNVSSCSIRPAGAESTAILASGPVVNGRNYYIAAVWDETTTTMRVYLAEAGNPASALTATTSIAGRDLAAVVINQFFLGSAVQFPDGDFNGRIDEFRIHNTALSVAEIEANCAAGPTTETAGNPNPTDNATLVPVTATLNWTAPTRYVPVGYNVRIGADPNVTTTLASGYTSTTIDPSPVGDLNLGVKYYWRIDALEPNSPSPIVHTGNVWSFTTVPPTPVVTVDPVSQTVASGTVIDLSVTALNTTTYAWYYSADAVVGAGDTNIGTGQTIQVTVDNVSKEGWYYCVASSIIGSDTSAMARVMIKRLVGYWDFEGNLTDKVVVGPTHDGSVLDPNFAVGVPQLGGQGYKFYGDGRIVTIADSVDYFNFYPQGITISCWVKNQNISIWDTLCSKEYEREIAWNVGKGFYLGRSDGGAAVFAIRPSEALSAGNLVTVADWHQLIGVHDPVSGVVRIYMDGVFHSESGANPDNFNAPNLAPLIFGAESTNGLIGSSTAVIDDMKIWNYARTSTEIAQDYVAIMGGYICVGGNPTGDLSGDCQVNLADLSILAQNWLENNRVE